jgi:KUP system potassium uptake protein
MQSANGHHRRWAFLSLAALGVVYGDIGTSPLYAVRECFYGHYAVEPVEANVLGVLSLVTWSLLFVISLKYLVFVLRADYDGEGGILALMELVLRRSEGRGRTWILMLGIFGASLLYGDGIITPAISVLSAVEGLEVVTPGLGVWVVPITVGILVALFAVQRTGTAGVGRWFGPIMLVWFATLAALGVAAVLDEPGVLRGLDPRHGVQFLVANGMTGLTILGIVFLVVTGGEALYADLGHFGTFPIRLSWHVVVLPSLLLNYFGQGALILGGGAEIHHPFYQLVPSWGMGPMVVLATAATVIASQAIISGAFSLSYQAMQLGYLPRLAVRHTSATERGQIYVPSVNWMLLVATVALVLGFRTSGALASAYGVAIATTMVITTLVLYAALRGVFEWRRSAALALCGFFLVFDLAYFAANMLKFADGGWVPLLVAGGVMLLMTTWRRGRAIERRRIRDLAVDPVQHLADIGGGGTYRRVPGTAVYLSHTVTGTPRTLVDNLEHNHVLHRRVVLFTVRTVRRPWTADDDRLRVERLRDDLHRVVAHVGFLERIDVPALLAQADREFDLDLDLDGLTYFVGDEFHVPTPELGMDQLRSHLYAWLARNQHRVTRFYHLPADQVIELGRRVSV